MAVWLKSLLSGCNVVFRRSPVPVGVYTTFGRNHHPWHCVPTKSLSYFKMNQLAAFFCTVHTHRSLSSTPFMISSKALTIIGHSQWSVFDFGMSFLSELTGSFFYCLLRTRWKHFFLPRFFNRKVPFIILWPAQSLTLFMNSILGWWILFMLFLCF